jgi:serine/threonine-protein kinase
MWGRGTVLGGRYTLVDRLGSGAMGEVWRAKDRVLERRVAVKLLRPGLLDQAKFAVRFRREAQLLAGFEHPGVVGIHDYGEYDVVADESREGTESDKGQEGTESDEGSGDEGSGKGSDSGTRVAYIVMELVQGKSLDHVCAAQGVLEPGRALDIVAQALDALHVAHLKDVVHRDIKPSNLMLRPDGRVAVTDFGIARAVARTRITPEGAVLGTPLYMAPEQAEGHPVEPAADLYAIGVVCYELLMGEPPFSGATAVELALKHIRQPAPELPAAFPEPVRAFVARALAKDPEDRYPSAAVMAAAARRAASGAGPRQPEGSGEQPPGTPGRSDKPKKPPVADKLRRRPVLVLAAVVVPVVSVTALYLVPPPWQYRADSPGATPSASASRDHNTSASPSASASPDGKASPSGTPSGSPGGGAGGQQDVNAGEGAGGSKGDSGNAGDSGDADDSDSSSGASGADSSDKRKGSATPAGCGGAGWGAITNVGSGRRIGLEADGPEADGDVIMGGHTEYGWVRTVVNQFNNTEAFTSCTLGKPQLGTAAGTADVKLVSNGAYTNGWALGDADTPGAHTLGHTAGQGCLTDNGANKRLAIRTCTPGDQSQEWRIP